MPRNKIIINDHDKHPSGKGFSATHRLPKINEGDAPNDCSGSARTLEDITNKGASTTSLVQLKKELNLLDGVGIILGITIGSGIFVTPGSVVRYTGSIGMSLIVWVVTGFMSMMGAFSYAEMGTMIQKSGGSYANILDAFGPIPGFLALWVNLTLQSPGSRAVGLITFSNYLLQPLFHNCSTVPYWPTRLISLALLGVTTYINCRGVRLGARVQNFLAFMKILAVIVIIALGIYHAILGEVENYRDPMKGSIYDGASIATAFYSTIFAYSGWDALNSVFEELKDPCKNLPRAIAISMVIVTITFTLTNMAYFVVLTPAEIMSSSAVAVTFGNRTMGIIAWIISLFVACSTFGNLNGGLITQSRLVYVAAREGQLPHCFSYINVQCNTPVVSLISIVILPAIMIFIPDVFTILAYTSFIKSFMGALSVSSLLWMRYKQPERHRPIKVWLGFPIMYLMMSVFVCVFPVVERPIEIGAAFMILVFGLIVYYMAIHRQFQCIKSVLDKFTYLCQMVFVCIEGETSDNLSKEQCNSIAE